MIKKRKRRLSEAVGAWIEKTDYATMTDEEQWWHKKITKILLNKSGKWGIYQHALYALRFQDFILKIVPLEVDPNFTACVYFDRAVVYIGEGFLVDDTRCYQLNVIIRHELAHILLRHQIRMVHHIGELPYSKISMSNSIHELINIIADFEISNKKYTSEDKAIVADMHLNGRLIGGLVTEMHRESWAKLPLEEMYDEIIEELDEISSEVTEVDGNLGHLPWGSSLRQKLTKKDYITMSGLSAIMLYANKDQPSTIWAPIEEYFETSKQFAKLPGDWKDLIKKCYAAVKELTSEKLEELLEDISYSKITETVDLNGLEVTTPEEKFWVSQVIKTLLGNARPKPTTTVTRATHSKDYIDAYNKVIRACGRVATCSNEELGELLGGITITEKEK